MQFDSLQELQRDLKSFSDPRERRIAEAAPFLVPQQKHIVLLLHGMNANAAWQEALPKRSGTHRTCRLSLVTAILILHVLGAIFVQARANL